MKSEGGDNVVENGTESNSPGLKGNREDLLNDNNRDTRI